MWLEFNFNNCGMLTFTERYFYIMETLSSLGPHSTEYRPPLALGWLEGERYNQHLQMVPLLRLNSSV